MSGLAGDQQFAEALWAEERRKQGKKEKRDCKEIVIKAQPF